MLVLGALIGAAAMPQEHTLTLVDRVAAGHRFLAGPAWPRDGAIVVNDVVEQRTYRFSPTKGLELWREDNGGAAGSAFDAQGRLIVCESRARRVVHINQSGQAEVLAERFEGHRLNSPSDVAVRHDGHIYFTDPAFGAADDVRELSFYGVFHLTPKGALSTVARWPKRPNGIALSPDGKLLYVAAADERLVRVYTLDRAGNASDERTFASGLDGPPAGVRTDGRGNVYVACARLRVFTPEGRALQAIEIPETPSNLAIGEGGQTLYVTARTSLYRVRLNVKGSDEN